MRTHHGTPYPLGNQITHFHGKAGVNFALFSAHASGVELCLFCKKSGKETRLPMVKSGEVWHLFVENIEAGTAYGYRVSGEVDESRGALFNPQKLLLDPYAKSIVGTVDLSSNEAKKWFEWHDPRDNAHLAPKSIVFEPAVFDWRYDKPLYRSWAESVIYEVHIKGFSQQNPHIPEALRGTFAGMTHPTSIAHLQRLGITTVELLPITFHIDEPHLQKLGLANYWGYNVLGHFALDPKLAANKADPLTEFKQLVKTLHEAGIEVMMDVVFNHTAELDKQGPMLCQRGIDNQSYYWLNEQGDYHNWTGCGNTLNLSTPAVLRWVIDCLCYWVNECHVDGFRFDLGAVLGRTPDFAEKSAFFTAIQSNSTLCGIKLIAEPWDIGNHGYQLGHFPAFFAEWNDRFRDEVRRFFLSDHKNVGLFARRFAGSDDLFKHNRPPSHSINFITAHDGFTLNDLVSYNEKHNEANGEQNRDGHSHNLSHNFGIEGATSTVEIQEKRKKVRMALLATLLLSSGTPMLLAGDEFGNSQQGNNNSYCQDNPIGWLNWENVDEELIHYTAQLIALRKYIPLLSHDDSWWTDEQVMWLTQRGEPMNQHDWQSSSPTLQILLKNRWLVLINATQATQQFLLPKGDWQLLLGEENPVLMTDTQAVTFKDLGVCVLQKRKNKPKYIGDYQHAHTRNILTP